MDAIYARQSIDKKDSLSIEGQIELCRRYCDQDAQVFQDKGFSGKNTKRPAFQQLITAIEDGKINRLFVYRLDRFSRSIVDFYQMWELLQKYNVSFTSVTENFDTSTPMGKAMLGIVMTFAQLERETTAERVKDNYIHRFSLGVWPGGPAPYGFDITKITDNGRLVSSLIANEKSETVKQVFAEYVQPDTSLRSIAKRLSEQGIHGPKREAWDNVTLSRILHSPLYVMANADIYWYYLSKGLQTEQSVEAFDGIHACNVIGRRDRSKNKYNSLDGQRLTVANHTGFIEPELWLKVQDKLSKNPQISRANAGKYSWLTGLMKCGKCGYSVKVSHNRKDNTFRLVCSGHSNFGNCDAVIHTDLRALENTIADEIEKTLSSFSSDDVYPESGEDAQDILAIDEKIQRLLRVIEESDDVPRQYILKEIENLHKQKEQMSQCVKPKHTPIKQLSFKEASFDEKKLIAAEFLQKILLVGNDVKPFWKF